MTGALSMVAVGRHSLEVSAVRITGVSAIVERWRPAILGPTCVRSALAPSKGVRARILAVVLCKAHWRKAIAAGTLPGATQCSAKRKGGGSCTRSATMDGMCAYHKSREGKAPSERSHAPTSHDRRQINGGGYVLLWRPNHPGSLVTGYITEHRLLVCEALGRKLLPTEQVHHRSGNKADNTIGPCFLLTKCDCQTRHNLELWTKSQPSGQRVADKLAWAHEIIALYGKAQQRLFV